MPHITIADSGKTIEVADGANLRRALLKHGISPYRGVNRILNCRGNGLCGTCRIEVIDGKGAPPMSSLEESALVGLLPFYARALLKNVRLACRITVTNDMSIKMNPHVSVDRKLTKERLILLAIWTIFGGAFLFVIIRLLIEIATGA
jgi:ferredoxin